MTAPAPVVVWARLAVGLAAATVAALVAARVGAGAMTAGGAARDQPALPTAVAAAAAPIGRGPLRVVVLDGLARADSHRLPALEASCRRGLDLVVDVGYPTRSLLVQEVLWTGLSAQQLGSPYRNDARPPHAAAMPARIRSWAVVEAYRGIAASVGFARVEPALASADGADASADPAAVARWQRDGFAAAAVTAVASTTPLVMVHVLAIDAAAHRDGRRGERYHAALLSADRTLAAVVAALPADAGLLVLADHGHRVGGGHGDAEDEVRRVRACAVGIAGGGRAGDRGAEVHLVDIARLIADRLGLAPTAGARGRPLAIARANPAPDATLPAPSRGPGVVAALALVVTALLALRVAGIAALWPALALLLWWLGRGAPSLSNRPGLDATTALALLPLLPALRRASTPRRLAVVAAAALAPALAVAVHCGLLAAVLGGPPPRLPGWSGQLALWALLSIAGLAAGALTATLRRVSAARTGPRPAPAPPPATVDGNRP